MIRGATAADFDVISDLNHAAFAGPDEAALVERLRADGDMLLELVEDVSGQVLGHIAFSRLKLHGPYIVEVSALAPIAVRPDRQGVGIGGALISAGLERCAERGLPAVVVLGHPDYYPRFGFSAASAGRLTAPFSGPAFMALELAPGALGASYVVQYASAFGLDGWFETQAPKAHTRTRPDAP